MREYILDLHIHSRYSRACSKDLLLPNIATACETRGIDIVATGDFTHPAWFRHMMDELAEAGDGVYRLKNSSSPTRFIIGTEVASIKKHAGQTRRVHHLIFAPSIEVAERFSATLDNRGINLRADGRPIIGMTSKEILEVMLSVDERMVMIPAHAWTPWFGVFGSKGGYASLEECYEDLTPRIRAIETGLSSDPVMNRRWSAIDHISLVSNSDAHSLQKLGREANVLQLDESTLSYASIMDAVQSGDNTRFRYTIEFYPEEGKYHLDGHAACGVALMPSETKKNAGLCSVCKKPLTIGVLNRVEEFADRTEAEAKVYLSQTNQVAYRSLVPLPEIIADTIGTGVATKGVKAWYETLVSRFGSEFAVLLHASEDEIAVASTREIATAIARVRSGDLEIKPGYDGVFGVIRVFKDGEKRGARQDRLLLE